MVKTDFRNSKNLTTKEERVIKSCSPPITTEKKKKKTIIGIKGMV